MICAFKEEKVKLYFIAVIFILYGGLAAAHCCPGNCCKSLLNKRHTDSTEQKIIKKQAEKAKVSHQKTEINLKRSK